MTENRVKDPLGHYAEIQQKASPVAPMSDLEVLARAAGLIVLGLFAVGALVYGLFF